MACEHSIWLLPSATQQPMLAETITRLSALRGGAGFAPHVTIQGDLDLPLQRLAGPLGGFAASMPVQSWRVRQVECSAHFFRCLYLLFGAAPAFAEMQNAVSAFTQTADGLSPFAHLSLAYGQAHPDNAALCQRLSNQFAGQEIVFDRLAISRSSKNLPIADWQCLAQYTLAGPNQ